MSPSPRLMMALVVILSVAVVPVLVLLGLIWSRLRAIAPAEAKRLVEELARRQEALAELVAKLDAGEADRQSPRGRHPGGSPPRWSFGTRRVDAPVVNVVSGPTLIAVPNLAGPPAEVAPPAEANLARRFGAIWELADSGASPEAIARGTGQPIGQVELILALRRQLAAQPRESAPR